MRVWSYSDVSWKLTFVLAVRNVRHDSGCCRSQSEIDESSLPYIIVDGDWHKSVYVEKVEMASVDSAGFHCSRDRFMIYNLFRPRKCGRTNRCRQPTAYGSCLDALLLEAWQYIGKLSM